MSSIRRPRSRSLDLALSGSATVGRDMIRAAAESSRDTELWTVLLVLFLLILVYQAPLMAIIPLMTVAVATEISLALLACLAQAGFVNLFAGIEVYVKVLSYGAGVDYCLFLIARYKEELDEGATFDQAVENSLAKVGHALVASAGTVICGIFMMYFAEFGKFSQAGVAITIGLVIVLLAALTFSPALLRLTRRWAFWPRPSGHSLSRTAGWVSATSLWSRLFEQNWGQLAWTKVSVLAPSSGDRAADQCCDHDAVCVGWCAVSRTPELRAAQRIATGDHERRRGRGSGSALSARNRRSNYGADPDGDGVVPRRG